MINRIDFDAWFWVESIEACVCVPAKCGGTSFYRAVFNVPDGVPDEHVRSFAAANALARGHGPFAAHDVPRFFPYARKILSVRHPVSRFASLWRDKCQRRPGPTMNSTEYLRGWTPRQLMDLIVSFPHGDPHWVPQSAHLVPGAEVIRYTNLPAIVGYEIRANATAGDVPMDDVAEDLGRHYAQDIALWERARGS